MKAYFLAGGCILLGVFAILFFLVGIPIIQHMHDPINAPDVLLRETTVQPPITAECRQKQTDAAKLIDPLKTLRNDVSNKRTKIIERSAFLTPAGKTVPADQYLIEEDRPRYQELSDEYFKLSQEISAIELQYACT